MQMTSAVFSMSVQSLLRLCSALMIAAAALVVLGNAAFAEDMPIQRRMIDGNGVELATGLLHVQYPSVSIGPEVGGLTYSRTDLFGGDGQQIFTSVDGRIDTIDNGFGRCICIVTIGRQQSIFLETGGVNATGPFSGRYGEQLTYNPTTKVYTFTGRDGTIALFAQIGTPAGPGQYPANLRVTSLQRPSGEVRTFSYRLITIGGYTHHRLQSVANNFGYQLKLEYTGNTLPWRLSRVRAINNTIDYCDPLADTCTALTQTWPSLTFTRTAGPSGTTIDEVTDNLGRTTRYTTLSGSLQSIRRPTSASDNYTYTWRSLDPVSGAQLAVATVSDGAGTWTYSSVDSEGGDTRTTTITTPTNAVQTIVSLNFLHNQVASITNDAGQSELYEYDGYDQLTKITAPEGNYTQFTYDARGNVTQVRAVAKAGSGLADIVANTAMMEGPSVTTCSNIRTCNQPASITDARGNVTNFTYDPTHGGPLTVTGPAPSAGGVRPQTRFAYTQLRAWYRTSSSTTKVQGAPIYLLTQTSACTTSTSCANQAQEARATAAYQSGSASVGSNLLQLSASSGSGDGALTATTAWAYDMLGNVLTEDGPLPGVTDTTRFRYDAVSQMVGVVGPNPGGGLNYPATRTTYNGDGLATSVELGTVASQSDSDWAAMTVLSHQTTAYDAQARSVRSDQYLGGVRQAVAQASYDAMSRIDCIAVRMNPAVFASLPASACTASTQGANGPDRITRNTYNNLSQLTQVVSGYGTSAAVTEKQAYTANGRVDWMEDGAGNRSQFAYDGFDRALRLYFPQTTIGAHAVNNSDYEQYGYDPNGNVVSLRVRSGETISLTYDALNRTIHRGGATADVDLTYDLLNRPLSTLFTSGGQGTTYAFDALGRLLSETSYGRTLAHQYDLANNRTRLTFPDANYIQYTYDVLGRMLQVRENGATSGAGLLATYAYDNLGRRASISRGNGTATTFTYAASAPDWSLTQNVSGTTQDLTLSFTANPAGQTSARTPSNLAYAYAPSSTGTTNYTRDGLNRYTNVGGASIAYDARQNLTSDGARTFAYDVENRLTSVSGSVSMTLAYDPLGRLRQTVSGGTTRQFLYDGDALVGEYDSAGSLVRRYVHGAGVDEPLVWFEGAGLSNRAWLHTDELGSVIATSDGAGAATPYAYSAFGQPANDNWTGSRFRYTGQIALNEVRLYHYKARVYDPALGRFLQTDPIGYADGMNLYAYVGNDPANLRDPTGLQGDPPVVVNGTPPRPEDPYRPSPALYFYIIPGYTALDPGYEPAPQGLSADQLAALANAPFVGATEEIVVTGTRCMTYLCQKARFDANRRGLNARMNRQLGQITGFIATEGALTAATGGLSGLRYLRFCGCFVEGTEVATPDGLRPIEEIAVGDRVLSWNPETGETTTQTVTALVRPEPKLIWRLTTRDGDGETETFEVTDDHPWYVEGAGWVETQHLAAGQRIETADDRGLLIVDIARTDRVEMAYNLEVAGPHTFLVGEDHVVVHNNPCTWLINVTRRTRIPNFQINTTRSQFAANLRANGWTATPLSRGAVQYTNPSSGVSYVIRGATSTPTGGAIDVLNSSNQVIRVYRPGG